MTKTLARHALLLPALALLLFTGCASRGGDASKEAAPSVELINTYWKIVEVGGQPIKVGDGGREPSLVLASEEQKTHGSTGCNRFAGTYTLDGDALAFGPLAVTKMACLGEDVEGPVLDALQRTNAWSIADGRLSLREGETVLAVCEAVALP